MTHSTTRRRCAPRLLFRRPGAALFAALLGGAVPGAVAAPQILDPTDETPRSASGTRFDAQMLWFSESQPDGAARAALSIAEGVAEVALDGVPAMSEGEPRATVGLAEFPRALARRTGTEGGLLSVGASAGVRFQDGDPMPVVAIAPRIQDRMLRLTSLPPSTAREIAWAAAGLRLERAAQDGAALLDDPVLRAGARAALAHRGLEAADRGAQPFDDPILSSGAHVLIEELAARTADGAPREEALRAIARSFAASVAGADRASAKVFDPEVPLRASAGEIACRLLFEAKDDAAEALAALGVDPTRPAAGSPRFLVESGAVGRAGDAIQASATRRLDALCLERAHRAGPIDVSFEVLVVANDGKTPAQADLVFGEDGEGDRFLVALNQRQGLYLFRREGPEAGYEPLIAREDFRFPTAQWVPMRLRHDGSEIELLIADQPMYGYRHKGRSLDGKVGFGAHAGSTAFFRNLKIERGPEPGPEDPAGGADGDDPRAGGGEGPPGTDGARVQSGPDALPTPDRVRARSPSMHATVLTPTPDLEGSLDFYARAGFVRVDGATAGVPESGRAALTDGSVTVEIDADRHVRTSLVLRGEGVRRLVDSLRGTTRMVERDAGFVVADPNGVRVQLRPDDPWTPVAPTETPAARFGAFAGLSIEAFDPEATVSFWKTLGYAVKAGGPDAGWTQLGRDGAIDVSVMGPFTCPHLFFNPGLTYFNSGRNPEIIAELRSAGVPLTEEITVFNERGDVDNVIVRDPGGTGFFVFND
ncbi:MAG: hypothetical protein AAFU73_21060 [Planctomycetota bacterium]